MKKKNLFDVIILGSGIAGMSLGAKLSETLSVCILEKEKIISYHSTGRSFAFYIESYGNNIIRKLTKASKEFFINNKSLDNQKILKKRGALYLANKLQINEKNNLYIKLNDPKIEKLTDKETLKLLPCINEKYIHSSIYDSEASDIDVNILYNIFLKKFKNNNGQLFTDTNIINYKKHHNSWEINTHSNKYSCNIIVNAGGAWSDEISKNIGGTKIGLVPKKRTVFCFKPNKIKIENKWPLAVDVEENFYFKIENDIVLASPADETPSYPHDSFPDDYDIAVGIDRIKNSTIFDFKSIINKWSGLRNFVEDKTPVIGFDKQIDNFFWLTGQGGYGIQTSPALADICNNLILNISNNNFIEKYEINIDLMDVKRFSK